MKVFELTAVEKAAVCGLIYMESDIARRKSELAAELERNHGLPPGALSTTHQINHTAGVILPSSHPPGDANGQ